MESLKENKEENSVIVLKPQKKKGMWNSLFMELNIPYVYSISTFYPTQKRNGSWKMTMSSHKPNQVRIIIEAAFSDLFSGFIWAKDHIGKAAIIQQMATPAPVNSSLLSPGQDSS